MAYCRFSHNYGCSLRIWKFPARRSSSKRRSRTESNRAYKSLSAVLNRRTRRWSVRFMCEVLQLMLTTQTPKLTPHEQCNSLYYLAPELPESNLRDQYTHKFFRHLQKWVTANHDRSIRCSYVSCVRRSFDQTLTWCWPQNRSKGQQKSHKLFHRAITWPVTQLMEQTKCRREQETHELGIHVVPNAQRFFGSSYFSPFVSWPQRIVELPRRIMPAEPDTDLSAGVLANPAEERTGSGPLR